MLVNFCGLDKPVGTEQEQGTKKSVVAYKELIWEIVEVLDEDSS